MDFKTTLRQFFLPFLDWFPLPQGGLQKDIIAGITVALVLIPQSMAYAALAGMPPHYGLYAAFVPVLVGGIWGSSKQLATGPVAVVSLLTAAAITPLAEPGSGDFIALAVVLAAMVGIIQLTLGLFRLGAVVSFISHPVVLGFTNAAAIIIGLSQLNSLLGVPMERQDNFILTIAGVLGEIPATHLPTLLMGAAAIAIMLLTKRLAPRVPGVLLAVVVTILASWALDFEAMGGAVVGNIPEGLPAVTVPAMDWNTMTTLITSAFVIALVGFMEAISIAKAIAAKTKDRLDASQELVGQGLANLTGSFTQSFPVSGSFSRSAVNYNAGAVSGLSSVATGVVVVITLLFLTPLLYHLPQSVLAAIIIMAVIGLINVKAIKHAWEAHKHDGIAAIVTFGATLAFAPHLDQGILVGAGLAIILYLTRTMRPRVITLSRHPDGTLRDAKYFNLPVSEHVTAVRFDGDLYFANVAAFEDAILQVNAEYPRAKYILVVGNGINDIDASGEEAIHNLVERLRANDVTLVFAGLKLQVMQVMQRTGLYATVGAENFYRTEEQALEAIYERIDDPEFDARFCPLTPLEKQARPDPETP